MTLSLCALLVDCTERLQCDLTAYPEWGGGYGATRGLLTQSVGGYGVTRGLLTQSVGGLPCDPGTAYPECGGATV